MAEVTQCEFQTKAPRDSSESALALMELWDHLSVKKPSEDNPATLFIAADPAGDPNTGVKPTEYNCMRDPR